MLPRYYEETRFLGLGLPDFAQVGGDAHGAEGFQVSEDPLLTGVCSDLIPHPDLGFDGPARTAEIADPHAAQRLVTKTDGQTILYFGSDQDRADAVGDHVFNGVGFGDQSGTQIFQPADVDGVVDDLGVVDVVGHDGYGECYFGWVGLGHV